MSFKSDCDFNDFDEKRADFIYQNAIDLWKSLEESIQHIKRNAVVLLGYLLGSSSLLINLFFNQNAEKYQLSIIICILLHLAISIYIAYRVFLPTEITLPFLSPKDLLEKNFNYEDNGSIIELPKLKLKILQDIIYKYIQDIKELRISLANTFKKSILFTILAPFASIIGTGIINALYYYLSSICLHHLYFVAFHNF
ncbi:MAG: hypothetical protein IJT15_01210 [Rickettsiales bacterium]|nr:hypothetical protein [Rickettsiales bacterium]